MADDKQVCPKCELMAAQRDNYASNEAVARNLLKEACEKLAREREVAKAAADALKPMAQFGPPNIDAFDDNWRLPVYPGAFSVAELRAARAALNLAEENATTRDDHRAASVEQ